MIEVVREARTIYDDITLMMLLLLVTWAIFLLAAEDCGNGVGLKVRYQTWDSHDPIVKKHKYLWDRGLYARTCGNCVVVVCCCVFRNSLGGWKP